MVLGDGQAGRQAVGGANVVSVIDIYELHARTCDLSRYGTREKHFYPGDKQAVSWSATRPKSVQLYKSKGFYSSCQLEKRSGCFDTEAYDHCVDDHLARKQSRALLKSPEISSHACFQVFSDCVEAAQPFW